MKNIIFFLFSFLLTLNLAFGQHKFSLLPSASFLSERIKYDYAFSTTKIHMNRKATGFSIGGYGMVVWNKKISSSLGILFNQTGGANYLTTNLGTSSSGTNPNTFLYSEVQKSLQIPLLFDYNISTYSKVSPNFTDGIVYSHLISNQKTFFFVPEDKYPFFTSFGAGIQYDRAYRTSFFIVAFLNYDFFKTEFYSNYRAYQVGLQIRVKNIETYRLAFTRSKRRVR